MKKSMFALLAGLLLAGGLLYATDGSIHRLTVGDTEVWNIDEEGDVTAAGALSSSGDLRYGVSGVAETIATTSRNSQGTKIPMILDESSSAALEGSVLVVKAPTSDGKARVTLGGATNDLTTIVGVAAAAASPGAVVDVYVNGFVLARTTGTVNPGAILVSTTAAAGYLATNANSLANAGVGIAISTGTASGGLTKILLFK